MAKTEHDSKLCRCLSDEQAIRPLRNFGATNDADYPDPQCACFCSKCLGNKIRHDGVVRRARLELRLAKAGIGVNDLADLLQPIIMDGVRRVVGEIVTEQLRDRMSRLRIRQFVSIDQSSISFGEDENGG